MTPTTPSFSSPPLVGRADELASLRAALDAGADGRGGVVFLTGDAGVGKTRLVEVVVEDARRREWTVAVGRGYPVETGVPYALFSDAMLPVLRSLDASTLAVLTRGREAELAALVPPLALEEQAWVERAEAGADTSKTALFWNFAQFLERLSERAPVLFLFEDLHWVDASSLELLHFLARQLTDRPVLVLATFNDAGLAENETLRSTRKSLLSLGLARTVELAPLSAGETDALVRETFSVDEAVSAEFSRTLFEWTRGNPFFVTETLRSLVESGHLYERDGTWLGWEIEELQLPKTVRDVVVVQLDRLGPAARAVADFAAVIGTRVTYTALEAVSDLRAAELVEALDELCRRGVLGEAMTDEGDVVYDFLHPVVRQTLYAELGRARARFLHGRVAQVLEDFYGDRAAEHVDELAFQFVRAGTRELAPKAVRYLAAAGRDALARRGDREAANYLSAALEYIERGDADAETDGSLLEDLARARQRLGDYDGALKLWRRARAEAASEGDSARVAAIERRIGLACFWSGRPAVALEHYDAALDAVGEAGTDPGAGTEAIAARVRTAKGVCLLELGRRDEAEAEVDEALEAAERDGDPVLLARVHRSSLLLHAWTGPPERARDHGERAVELAESAGESAVACTAHWALAIVEGFTGRTARVAEHLEESQRLADEAGSPILRLAADEVAVEYMYATGDWETGLALAERSIALARALNQRALLPRLLVWAALLYLGRGDIDRGKAYVDEAWERSGAELDGPTDVHSVVPAHTGLAAYHIAVGEYEEAIRVGEAGLAIVDRTGYVAWAVHRLLPTIAEAHLWPRWVDGAARYGERLRRDSERLGHKLGLAWADACDACVAWLSGDVERAVGLLRGAAEALEAVPFVPDAARLRRQLAGRLADIGDREGAARELRRVHAVLSRLGAERELEKARDMFREIGARPPPRTEAAGAAGLTPREVEIARLVVERKSNKAIGRVLGISPRTVSTHLSNIYKKLEIGSRGELVDFARRSELPTV